MEKKPACILELEKALGREMDHVPFDDLWEYHGSAAFSMNQYEVVDGLGFNCIKGEIEHLTHFPHLRCLVFRTSDVEDLSHLASLTALTQLDLGDNQILDISPLASLTALTQLDLYDNRIQDISPLASLTALNRLNLIRNQIQDISPLASLTALTQLDLHHNYSQDLSPLASLTALAQLNLRHNYIQNLSHLASLTALTQLDLSDNQIQDLSHLASLTALTQLELDINQIQDLSHLASLTALKQLDLSYNQIQDISHLATLTALTQLHLSGNQIQNISPLASLAALTQLHLHHNQIQGLSHLASLTALTQLDLDCNQIQDLSHLASLTALTRLDLASNQIQDLAHLASLTSLTQVSLHSNKIQDLTPLEGLGRSSCPFIWSDGYVKKGIDIADNPLQRPPLEIARQGHEAIMAFFDAQRETQHPLNEVKVLLVGAGGAGKTSLVKALMKQTHDPHESQTHGIRIERWQCPGEQGQVHVRLWDFGGQEIMHATHQFFMSERCLYILVLDGRKEEAREEYWLKLIESFGGDSKVLVVINKIDENPGFELNRRALLDKFPQILGFHRLSCAKGMGVDDFRQTLAEALGQVELIQSSWPESWFQVKSHLETSQMDYISYQDYLAICTQHQLTAKNQQETLLAYLHDLGVSLHFADLEWLNTQVLNPAWITNPVYDLINHKELAHQQGIVPLKQLPALLPSFPQDRLPFLLKLMQKFELSYELGDKLLVTDLLPVAQPEPPLLQDPLHFSVRYYFLPNSILQRLMVRRHHEIEPGLQWRTGMVLRHPQLQSRALITTDAGERRLRLQLDGSRRREYLALILDSLREIHTGYSKIEPVELLRCSCSRCRASASPAEYNYEQVLVFQTKGTPLHCLESAETVSVDNLIQQAYIKPKTETELMEVLSELRQTTDDKTTFVHMARIILRRELAPEQATRLDLEPAITRAWAQGQRAQQPPSRPAAFLCVATEWDSGKGGLTTFNRELCIALAAAGHPCYCLVPQYDEAQRQAAEKSGVQLIAPPHQPGLSEEALLLAKLDLPSADGPYWVIGHDRITGPQAAARVAQGGYAGLILFVHTIPNEIEWFKHENDRDPMREAETRDDLQLQLALKADLVVAVGPRIREHMEYLLQGVAGQVPPLLRLDPGLGPFANPGKLATKRSCLLLGRAEDEHIKGLDIAARALGQLHDFPVTLVLRGAATGTGAQLKSKLEKLANNSQITIQPQEYTSQREKIQADLRRATLVLMPSRTEGFGLVGLEAIAAGIPVLVSANSGLAQLLNELDGPNHKAVVPVTNNEEKDNTAWSRKIFSILEEPESAFVRAQALHSRLQGKLTWSKAIKKLLDHMPQPKDP